MLRRICKNNEISVIKASDIIDMPEGNHLEAYLCAPFKSGYLLGFDEIAKRSETKTSIYSSLKEKVLVESKINPNSEFKWNIEKINNYIYI